MLIDRIKESNLGFHVKKEKNAPNERELYFGFYTFKDDAGIVPANLQKCAYWKPMADDIKVDKSETLIYFVEKNGEKIDGEARIFWSRNKEKPKMIIRTVPADSKYGEQAYEISVMWQNCAGESINNDYFYLKSVSGEQYHFLRPTVGGPGINEESYIYIVPEGDYPGNYTVAVHPLLEEKYNVIIDIEK